MFAHHIGVEILGREYSPETPMQHVVVGVVSLAVLALIVYGAYAAVRDIRRWLRTPRQQPPVPGESHA